MSKSQVALVKGEDIQANVTRVFDLLGGVQNVIRPGTTFRDGGAMQIPKYYILADICGILILGFTVYCITKIGPVMTASITVSVQLIVATLASHYGWLGLEHEPINWVKILGIAFLVAGVVLVKISIK